MKNKSILVRCKKEDQELIRWGAEQTKLEQSEVVRQGLRLGVPLLVKRIGAVTPHTAKAESLRRAFKRPVKMGEIMKATEQSH